MTRKKDPAAKAIIQTPETEETAEHLPNGITPAREVPEFSNEQWQEKERRFHELVERFALEEHVTVTAAFLEPNEVSCITVGESSDLRSLFSAPLLLFTQIYQKALAAVGGPQELQRVLFAALKGVLKHPEVRAAMEQLSNLTIDTLGSLKSRPDSPADWDEVSVAFNKAVSQFIDEHDGFGALAMLYRQREDDENSTDMGYTSAGGPANPYNLFEVCLMLLANVHDMIAERFPDEVADQALIQLLGQLQDQPNPEAQHLVGLLRCLCSAGAALREASPTATLADFLRAAKKSEENQW